MSTGTELVTRQLGQSGVASHLVHWLGSILEVDRGCLGFDEEFTRPADAKAVVERRYRQVIGTSLSETGSQTTADIRCILNQKSP